MIMKEKTCDVATAGAHSADAQNALDGHLRALQTRRVEARNNVTLDSILQVSNPHALRLATMDAASLAQHLLSSYLESSDGSLFDEYCDRIAEESGQRRDSGSDANANDGDLAQAAEMRASALAALTNNDLPMRHEVREAYNRSLNRLLRRIYAEYCDADAKLDRARLSRYLTNR